MRLCSNLRFVLPALALSSAVMADAQLCQNPDKILGNITTAWQINPDNIEFASLWNQLTPENESKWASMEDNRDNMGWGSMDNIYNYCKQHGVILKHHTLVWGSQYPGWMDRLQKNEQYEEIVEWMDALKARYPDLQMIDVVNEAIPGHAPAPYKDALGGDGVTGYDWIVKAFQMAYDRWPDAILIYNDYNTFQWQKSEFINLVKTIRDAGAPVDAYGCQSHDLTDIDINTFKASMSEIQNALKIPMYATEYDIATEDDQKQLRQYRDQIKYMWERTYVGGVTLWGFIYGKTWTTNGNSGIIRNGADRPAMTWLKEYMASDVAKTAKGPYPGNVKEASVYVIPQNYKTPINEETTITVEARMRTKEITQVLLYANNNLVATMTESPYEYNFTPDKLGRIDLRAVVMTADDEHYDRLGGMYVVNQCLPFGDEPIELPGTIEAENFDRGGDGLTFHDSDHKDEGKAKYRDDNDGVDIIAIDGGYGIGYTSAGEWLDYTVDVKEEGRYTVEAVVSSGADGSEFTISVVDGTEVTMIPPAIKVPNTGDWGVYTTVKRKMLTKLKSGVQKLRLSITGAYANIDKVNIYLEGNGIDDIDGDASGIYDVYTTTGIHVGTVECDDAYDVYVKVGQLTGNNGVYVVRNTRTNESRLIKATL